MRTEPPPSLSEPRVERMGGPQSEAKRRWGLMAECLTCPVRWVGGRAEVGLRFVVLRLAAARMQKSAFVAAGCGFLLTHCACVRTTPLCCRWGAYVADLGLSIPPFPVRRSSAMVDTVVKQAKCK
jgi:hypothetical protein